MSGGRTLTIEQIEQIAAEYMAERNNIEQDDMPVFTVDTVPVLLERLRKAAS